MRSPSAVCLLLNVFSSVSGTLVPDSIATDPGFGSSDVRRVLSDCGSCAKTEAAATTKQNIRFIAWSSEADPEHRGRLVGIGCRIVISAPSGVANLRCKLESPQFERHSTAKNCARGRFRTADGT